MRSRAYWIACLVCIIGLGIASRVVHAGWILLDKYAGNALYAAMVYVLISLGLANGNVAERIFARLLGTEFSSRDLLAYAVGIFGVVVSDRGNNYGRR